MSIRWPRVLAALAIGGLLALLSVGSLIVAYGRIAAASRQISHTIMHGIGELVSQRIDDLRQDAYNQFTVRVKTRVIMYRVAAMRYSWPARRCAHAALS